MSQKLIKVAPSLLSADFLNLENAVDFINNGASDWFHLDVMDGVFVPNISFGFPVLKAVKKLAKKPLDVHLMITEPDRYIEEFKKAGADILTVHFEACTHLHRTLAKIKSEGMKAGVALNPHTPIDFLKDIISDIDLLLIMSVNPGFGGQTFIENTYSKIAEAKNLILRKNAKTLIEVDGGADDSNCRKLTETGVDVLVAGSFIFDSQNPEQAVKLLKNQ
jgi:ribulose-phosphate 3-epimerase